MGVVALRQLRPRSAGGREARDNTVSFRQFVAPLIALPLVAAGREANQSILQFHLHDKFHPLAAGVPAISNRTRRRQPGAPLIEVARDLPDTILVPPGARLTTLPRECHGMAGANSIVLFDGRLRHRSSIEHGEEIFL